MLLPRALRWSFLLVCLLPSAVVAGCGAPTRAGYADKAGGATAPVMLTLATAAPEDGSDARVLRYFVRAVAQRSEGNVRVRVIYAAGGAASAYPELRVARLVRDGRFDLGWVGARSWDELGVSSMRALQAPFLITSYPLLDRVLASPLGREMLGGIREAGVIGLALVPGELRHPLGVKRPLVRLVDYANARIDVPPSRTTDALLRALGADPVHLSRAEGFAAYSAGKVDGKEFGYLGEFGGIITANVTFFPTASTLFANRSSFDGVGAGRRRALQAAAEQTLEHVAATPPSEETLLHEFCAEGGRAALATTRDRAALVRAAQPMIAELERDRQTNRLIHAIRSLKTVTRQDSIVVPPRCDLRAG
jgi:TRAP-type C4-dicarboxylate transport system substrate-binding protein